MDSIFKRVSHYQLNIYGICC